MHKTGVVIAFGSPTKFSQTPPSLPLLNGRSLRTEQFRNNCDIVCPQGLQKPVCKILFDLAPDNTTCTENLPIHPSKCHRAVSESLLPEGYLIFPYMSSTHKPGLIHLSLVWSPGTSVVLCVLYQSVILHALVDLLVACWIYFLHFSSFLYVCITWL